MTGHGAREGERERYINYFQLTLLYEHFIINLCNVANIIAYSSGVDSRDVGFDAASDLGRFKLSGKPISPTRDHRRISG
jgi:hypothetical protein